MDCQNIFEPQWVRSQFPFFAEEGAKLHYLDSAATSQKPHTVLSYLSNAYVFENANVHRGVYRLSEQATQTYESARDKLAKFIGGAKREEVIFTSGTTGSVNLVARSWGEQYLKEGDEIVLSICEHHSNIVPWQILAQKKGCVLKFIPLNDAYRLDLEKAKELINEKTKLVAVGHVSNVLGTINPIKEIIALAKAQNAVTLVDGAQAVAHLSVDVLDLDCDFYCFSAHKMLGPTGIGVLYGKKEILADMDPFLGGGDMIAKVSVEGSTWAPLPYKFEAGTPPILQAGGFGAAVDFLSQFDREKALAHDRSLGEMILEQLEGNPNVSTFGAGGDDWVGVVTFNHNRIHPHDMAAIQDAHNVCIRAGHHCAQPLMNALGVPSTSRVSPYIYNNEADVQAFLSALEKAEAMF